MAELLYRIGRASARRPLPVIALWTVALVAAVLAYVVGAGTLAGGISIPDTPTAEVTERLEREFPEVAGGTGTVVQQTTDGSEFTAEQQAAIRELIAEASSVDGVRTVVDPFATEAERAAAEQQIVDGRAQIDQARAEIEAGQAQIDQARAEIEAAREQLAQARQQAQPEPTADQLAALAAQEAELDAAAAQLDAQQQALEQAAADLDARAPELAAGAALLEMASEISTVSADRSAAVATVLFTETGFEITDETKEEVIGAFESTAVPGVDVDFSASIAAEIPDILGIGEAIGVVIAAVVLLVMLGTLIAAGLPLLTALVGVAIGALAALSLSGVVEMVSVTPVLGVMLGLAVGIDYSLFILNRHRRQLRHGDELIESIGLANGTSGNTVVFAGATVLIALLALNVTGIPFLGLMGTVAAFSVAVAVLIAVTLTPALLGLIGTRVLKTRERAALVTDASPAPAQPRPMSTPSALARALIGVVALGVLALPAASLRLGLQDGSAESPDSTQYQAYTTITEQFGAGQTGTLLVVADLPAPATEPEGGAAQLAVAQELYAQDDVVAVAPVGTSADGMVAAYQVVPAEGASSESTENLVQHLREVGELAGGVPIAVAGQASGAIDISAKLADALPLYLGVVVGLSLLILLLVFRSLVVPVIATLGFVLSYFATLGAVVAIYQWGWLGSLFDVHDPGPVLNFLPTVLVGVLFGLAMDYMLFLGSGMREAYAHGAPARLAVVQGVRAGRAVVTAAALIMASVFGGFIFAESTMIRPIGFALAFGVLVDAFVVRMLIVPALLHLAGERAWWLPRWLDRLLPDVDVEGAALERRHPHHVTGVTTAAE